MILRKFIKHVTDQNWFAVGLDVIVVIVGIFLGLQVQDWNEGRQLKQEERTYLQKLHDEVVLMKELSTSRLGERTFAVNNLQHVVDILAGNLAIDELGPDHCIAIAQSSNYQNSVGKLASIAELEGNNSSSIIQNVQITDIISDYIRLHERWDNLTENARQGSVILTNEFPESFHLNSKINIRGRSLENNSYSCNFELMISNEAFKNILHSNARKYAVIGTFLRFHHERLIALHSALDTELAVTHEEPAQ
jgi:hypothetical protein